MAGKKKRKALTKKQILMLTLVILCTGAVMLVSSILLSQTGSGAVPEHQENVAVQEQPRAEASGSGRQPDQTVTAEASKPSAAKKDTVPAAETAPSAAKSQTVTVDIKTSETKNSEAPAQDKNMEPSPAQAAQNAGSTADKKSTSNLLAAAPSTGKGARLVFVFDDAGHNLKQLEPVLQLPFPVAVAVLPGLAHSADAADAIRKAGKQALLHQPMQAVNLSTDPGPGAIKPDMHTYEVEAIVRSNLAEVGPVAGINNHEGSLITATQSLIGAVLDVCQEEGIFFLDSRTNAETKAPQAALERGMEIYERDIFLDNTQDREDIIAMVIKGLTIAEKKGHAVLIGHVWSDGLAGILNELYPEIIAKGYVLTDLSGL